MCKFRLLQAALVFGALASVTGVTALAQTPANNPQSGPDTLQATTPTQPAPPSPSTTLLGDIGGIRSRLGNLGL